MCVCFYYSVEMEEEKPLKNFMTPKPVFSSAVHVNGLEFTVVTWHKSECTSDIAWSRATLHSYTDNSVCMSFSDHLSVVPKERRK